MAFVRLPTVSGGEVRPWSVYSRRSGSDLHLTCFLWLLCQKQKQRQEIREDINNPGKR